jgi:MerR family transcriptional activator of bmr gene
VEKRLFSIGEISNIKGITKKALRFYERIGLLKPSYKDPSNGYRYYSVDQFVYIDIIKAMRLLDISIKEIKAIFRNKDTGELMAFLDSQKEKAARKIDELRNMTRRMTGIQNTINHSLISISQKDVYNREIAQRNIVTLPFNDLVNDEAAIIEFSRFDRIIDEHRLVNTYETGILFKPDGVSIIPSLIFNTIDIVENSDPSITSTLPAGRYVCVCFNRENASIQTEKVTKYCEQNQLEPTLILQLELLNDVFSADLGYLELQLLV